MIELRVLGGLEVHSDVGEGLDSLTAHHKRAALLVYLGSGISHWIRPSPAPPGYALAGAG